jgi:hypothetical protein
MTAIASASTAIAVAGRVLCSVEQLALDGGTGQAREAHVLDLRQFSGWCQQRHLCR